MRDFHGSQLRATTIDRKEWFAGMDPVAILGFARPSAAYERLADDEKCYVRRADLGLSPGKPVVFISESGPYKLIMRSDKPDARTFQDWVTDTVLPAFRKDGMYVVREEKVATGLNHYLINTHH